MVVTASGVTTQSQRIGLDGYARILALTRTSPTTAQVSEATGVTHDTVRKILKIMHRLGLVHRHSWFVPKPRSRPIPLWGFGPDGDEPNPCANTRSVARAQGPSLMIAAIAQALSDGPLTRRELAAEMQLHPNHLSRVIAILHRNKLLYIASKVVQPIGNPTHVYAYGEGRDAKSKLEPRKEQARRWSKTARAKKKHLEMISRTAGNSDQLRIAA